MVPKSGAFMFDALLGLSPESALSPASSGASSPCSPRAAAPRSADKRPRALSSELAASESVQSIKRRPPAERPLGAAQVEAALHQCRASTGPKLVRALQRGGPSAGARDAAGLTPVMAVAECAGDALTAAQERQLAAVLRSLVGAGAEVNARDARGRTALHRALGASNLAAARALLLSGASLAAFSPADGYSGSDMVFSMGARGAALVQWLADAGKLPDVNARNSRGLAPIHIAVLTARKGDLALVKKLVQLGADMTEKDASGRTALNYAILLGKRAITDFFHDLAVKCAVALMSGDSSPDPAKLAGDNAQRAAVL